MFTGVGSDYERPTNPDLVLDAEHKNEESCARRVLQFLKRKVI